MTNWPWPLDGVQNWFESLWNNINSWIWSGVEWLKGEVFKHIGWLKERIEEGWSWLSGEVWKHILWLKSRVEEGWSWFLTEVGSRINWLRDEIVEGRNWLSGEVWKHITWLKDRIVEGWNWIDSEVSKHLEGFRKWAQDGLKWIVNEVYTRLTNTAQTLQTAFNGAFEGFVKGIVEFFSPILKPIQEFFAWLWGELQKAWVKFTEWLQNTLKWLLEQIQYVLSYLAGLMQTARQIFVTPIENMCRQAIDSISNAIKPGSPPPEIQTSVENMFLTLKDRLESEVDRIYSSPVDLGATVGKAGAIASLGIVASIVAQAIATAADNVQPLRRIGIPEIIRDIGRNLGLAFVCGTPITVMLETGLFRPLRYYYNEKYAPYIPREEDLIKLRLRGQLEDNDYYKYMRWQGYSHEWSSKLLEANRVLPSEADLRNFVWRGLISEDRYISTLRQMGYHEDFIDCYRQMLVSIPTPSDLVRFVVRECFPLEELPPAPEEFVKYMSWYGFDEKWCRGYWEAHWVLPSISNLQELFWRGIISEEEFRKYIVWHDYKPVPRPGISKSDTDLMLELMWDYPTKIDARWMYRWGTIDRDELLELAKARGVHPAWREKVVDAWIKNEYADEINRIVSELKRDYVLGFFSDEDFRNALRELGYREEQIEYELADAIAEAIREKHREILNILQKALEKGKIDEAEFRSLASKYGIQEWKINDIIELVRLEKMVMAE